MYEDFLQPKRFYDVENCKRVEEALLEISAGQTWTCLSPAVVIMLYSSQFALLRGQLAAMED